MPIRQLLLLAALVVVLFEARPTWARCTGDCSGNGDVAIDELMTAVNIALGQTPATPCPGACPSPPICIDYLLSAVSSALNGCAEIPTLSASTPADGATNVPSSAWIRLEFAADIDPTNLDGFELSCEDVGFTASATAIAPNVVVINPRDPLFDNCHVAWRGGSLSFSVAAAGAPATVLYDHDDTRRTSPFPDDAWTVADSSTRTGLRLAAGAQDQWICSRFSAYRRPIASMDSVRSRTSSSSVRCARPRRCRSRGCIVIRWRPSASSI
jgi:hypothetical protein